MKQRGFRMQSGQARKEPSAGVVQEEVRLPQTEHTGRLFSKHSFEQKFLPSETV